MITKKKLSYEGPVCEVFEVQSEAVMQTGSPWQKNAPGSIEDEDPNNRTYNF